MVRVWSITIRAPDVELGRYIDPHPEPQFQHQERPEAHVMLVGARAVLVEQPGYVIGAEQAALPRQSREQRVVSELLELVAEPLVDRTTEPHLRSIEQFAGQVRRNRRFE